MALAEAIPKWPTHTAVLPVGKGNSEEGEGEVAGELEPGQFTHKLLFHCAVSTSHCVAATGAAV